MTPRHAAVSPARVRPSLLLGALALLLLAATGCGDASPTEAGSGRFDALRIRLTLASDDVSSGRSLRSVLTVTNPTDRPVADPECALHGGRAGLVPAGETARTEDLWSGQIIDCGGATELAPGASVTIDPGPDFLARTMYGAALPPGAYQAVLQLDGLTHQLIRPVTVT